MMNIQSYFFSDYRLFFAFGGREYRNSVFSSQEVFWIETQGRRHGMWFVVGLSGTIRSSFWRIVRHEGNSRCFSDRPLRCASISRCVMLRCNRPRSIEDPHRSDRHLFLVESLDTSPKYRMLDFRKASTPPPIRKISLQNLHVSTKREGHSLDWLKNTRYLSR